MSAVLFTAFILPAAAQDVEDRPGEPAEKKTKLRDPFWPVNYVSKGERTKQVVKTDDGPKVVAPVAGENWAGAEKSLKKVTVAKSPDGTFYALVNSKVVKEGETVTAHVLEYVYTWTVKSIDNKKGMRLSRLRAAPFRKR